MQTADQALFNRELIKIHVLENSGLTTREAADELARRTHSDVVQVIGGKFVLYKKADVEAKKAVSKMKRK